jgi:hypothetical protein
MSITANIPTRSQNAMLDLIGSCVSVVTAVGRMLLISRDLTGFAFMFDQQNNKKDKCQNKYYQSKNGRKFHQGGL